METPTRNPTPDPRYVGRETEESESSKGKTRAGDRGAPPTPAAALTRSPDVRADEPRALKKRARGERLTGRESFAVFTNFELYGKI